MSAIKRPSGSIDWYTITLACLVLSLHDLGVDEATRAVDCTNTSSVPHNQSDILFIGQTSFSRYSFSRLDLELAMVQPVISMILYDTKVSRPRGLCKDDVLPVRWHCPCGMRTRKTHKGDVHSPESHCITTAPHSAHLQPAFVHTLLAATH